MSYPNLPILRDSSTTREAGIQAVRATNGLLKSRRLYSTEKMSFTVVHWLSDAQRTTLETAYQTFKNSTLTLAWPEDGQNYTVRFAAAPQHRRQTGYWVSTVRLEEV